jgi:hypothetical protein
MHRYYWEKNLLKNDVSYYEKDIGSDINPGHIKQVLKMDCGCK